MRLEFQARLIVIGISITTYLLFLFNVLRYSITFDNSVKSYLDDISIYGENGTVRVVCV